MTISRPKTLDQIIKTFLLVKHEKNHENTLWSVCFTNEFESFISVEYTMNFRMRNFLLAYPVDFNGLDVVFNYYCGLAISLSLF